MMIRSGSRPLRCAIYTRKSSEEGLDQEFNSLHAQREACEAYIRSQQHEGWQAIPAIYDDGGFSGGTMERPALARLLADIDARDVDIVVVYKVDRLTRSLTDFARIVDRFDQADVSFVSVTQQFNTTSSMGRLTLNILLSFAQFEREVTGERIRDKIAASKRKGLWMGGTPPLGYQAAARSLIINNQEASTVREIFRLYARLGSVREVRDEARITGLRTRSGSTFKRGALYHLLRNPVYRGRIRHKDKCYAGTHEAIIDDDLWHTVQKQLDLNARSQKIMRDASHSSLLAGMLYLADGARLTPTHASKSGRRYRYYITAPDNSDVWRIPATDIEAAAKTLLTSYLGNQPQLLDDLVITDPAEASGIFRQADILAKNIDRELLLDISARVKLGADSLDISFAADQLAGKLGHTGVPHSSSIELSVPATLRKRGIETKLVLPPSDSNPVRIDEPLIRAIAKGHTWLEQLKYSGCSITDIARSENVTHRQITVHLELAFLSPEIVRAVLKGRQPVSFTLQSLKEAKIPRSWDEQERLFGFA